MFKVTEDWIKAYQSGSGGWNREQLGCIGVKWPPRSGWIRRCVGLEISDEMKQRFEALRGCSRSERRQLQKDAHEDLFR